MKKLLLGVLALLGIATQAVAAPFTEGHAYKLKHYMSDLYFNMEIDGIGDGSGRHCASLQAEANASIVYFVQNPNNENEWQIRVNSADGPNLSSDNTWHSIINSNDGYYWSVTEHATGRVTFERTSNKNGTNDFLGPNYSATGYSAGEGLWTNQDGRDANKLGATMFEVIEYAVSRYPVTLTINYGNDQSIVLDLGYVEAGTTYTKPSNDTNVLTITGWTDGEEVTGNINLQGTLVEGVKPFKLNNIRFSDQWGTTNATGLLRAASTYDAGEFFVEVPVEGSNNFKIYSLNQLKWVGAAGTNVRQVTFSELAGEFQLVKHSSGAEAIGNAGAATSAQVFFNSRDNGIGTWSAGDDAGSHWVMVYDNTNYQANLTAAAIVVNASSGSITGSALAPALAAAEAKYNAVVNVADDVMDGFGEQKAALKNAIDAARAARLGVAGVDFAQIINNLNTTTAAINENVEILASGLKILANGNAFAALGIATEEGKNAWQIVVDAANAMEPSTITEENVSTLIEAYEALVATSANTPGGVYVTFEHPQVAGDMMCVRYGNGAYVGRYGDDVNTNKITWKIVAAESGFKLYSDYSAKYLKMPTGDNQNTALVDEADASVFVFDVFNPEKALYGVKYAGADVVADREYLHSNNGHTVVRWQKGENSSWYLAPSSADVAAVENAQGATDQLADAIASCEVDQEKVGEGLGYYSVSQEYVDALAAAQAATESDDAATKRAAAVELFAAYTNALILHEPVAGKFYRFQNKHSNLYITSNVNDYNDLTLVADGADALETIFYFDGTRLVAWQDGLVFGNYNTSEAETSWKTVLKGASNEGVITFPVSDVIGSFYIQTQLDRRLYGGADTGRGSAVDCAGLSTGAKYSWAITEVTELPIAYNEEFVWSTLYSPVQLGLIENKVKAYTGTLNDEDLENVTLVVTELKGSIPANTGVILGVVKSDDIVVNGYVYLPIEDNTAEEVDSDLAGSFYTVAQEDAATAAEEGVYNFLFQEDTVTDPQTGEDSNFGKFNLDMASNLVGFTAYVTTSSIDADEVITIADNEGNNPTGIEEIEAESDKVQGIYDLQGRRLSAPVKGINIINGKKVLVK